LNTTTKRVGDGIERIKNMKESVKSMLTLAIGLGILEGALMLAKPVPACLEEDGSGQYACYWDASQPGNGVGASYVIVDGKIQQFF